MKDFHEDKINSLTLNQKQEIMDLMMERSLNIGQICQCTNLETGVVAGVIVRQIKEYLFLKKNVSS